MKYLILAACLATGAFLVSADNNDFPHGETIKHGIQTREKDRINNRPLDVGDELSEEKGWVDITPELFKFNTALGQTYTTTEKRESNSEIIRSLTNTSSTHNLDGFKGWPDEGWVKKVARGNGTEVNPDFDLSKGMFFLSGGSLHPHYDAQNRLLHEDQRETFKSGISMFDFGDEVGNVWMFNGNESDLLSTLSLGYYYNDELKETVDKASELIIYDKDNTGRLAQVGDYTLVFFPIDPVKYQSFLLAKGEDYSNKSYTIRVQAEFNTYANYPNGIVSAIGDINGILDNYGSVIRSDESDANYNVMLEGVLDDKESEYLMTHGSYYLPDGDYDASLRKGDSKPDYYGKMCWDATSWTLYETNLIVKPKHFDNSGISMIDGVPCMRIQFPTHNMNRLAYFLRNVRMFIKEGEESISDAFPSGSSVRITRNEYLLRPKDIFVMTKKLFVNEPNRLEGIVQPTWATRDIRWVLVDNEGRQYQSLDGAPEEITDYIEAFDPLTGEITARRNGSVLVQAISRAEGKDPDGNEVYKVMSAVTRLPIYNVVHEIDINHLHHSFDVANNSEKTIQLSGNESTRVEYELRTFDNLELSDGVAKFDPETPLHVEIAGTSHAVVSDNYAGKGNLHGLTYKNYNQGEDLLYKGTGVFDIFINEEAGLKKSSKIIMKVDDGRETWEMYANDPRFAASKRDGVSLLDHYAEPSTLICSHNHDPEYAGQFGNKLAIRLTESAIYQFDILIGDKENTSDPVLQNWILKENVSCDCSEITVGNGKLIIKPKHVCPIGHPIVIRTNYAGFNKSLLANEIMDETEDAPSASLRKSPVFSDPASNENNTDYTVFNLYDKTWESQWTGTDYFSHEDKVKDLPLEIYIFNSVITSVDDLLNENNGDNTEYYTLNGLKIEKPTLPGIYLLRRGNTVTKTIIR